MSLLANYGLLGRTPPVPPPVPPSYQFALTSSSYAATAARQVTLEPGSGGVDVPMSWSMWLLVSNYSTEEQQTTRVFGVFENGSNLQQYVLAVTPYSSASYSRSVFFSLLNAANSASISIGAPLFLRNRWYHVVITYDGSETNAGFEIYLNGVIVSAPVRISSGSYVGVGNSSTYRFSLSNILSANRRQPSGLRDVCVWNRVITASEVTDLYNSDVPIDVDTLPFYAAAVRAYYPLRANVNCLNNAVLNLTNAGGVTFVNQPISTTYPYLSMFQGLPGNTAYLAFGSLFKIAATFMHFMRSGTSHVSNGKIVQVLFSGAPYLMSCSSLVDVIPFSVLDRRLGSAFSDGSDILQNVCEEVNGVGTVVGNTLFTSTDGQTGQAYNGGVAITTPETSFIFYGKVHADYVSGDFVAGSYGVTGAVESVYFSRFSGGVWSFTSLPISGLPLGEPALIKCGNNTYIMLCRRVGGSGIYQMSSTDGGSTWTLPAITNLGVGQCMCDGTLTGSGRLTVVYSDRAAGEGTKMSMMNVVATVVANPLAWNTPVRVCGSYVGDSLNMLGYPSLVPDPANPYYGALCVSLEFSASRADTLYGYGLIDYG